MMKFNLHLVCIALAALLAVSCGVSKEDQAVDELVREASELVKLAEGERERKVTEAEYLEREALTRLDQAVALYPDSNSAYRLLDGETRIGPYTFEELKERVAAQQQVLAQAMEEEQDEIAVALEEAGELAGRPGPIYYQSGILARLAAAYARRDRDILAEEYFARSLIAAQAVEAPYYKILALSGLAGQYVLAGREEAAAELLVEAEGLIEEIEYPFFRAGASAVIAARYLAIGEEEAVRAIVETIEDPYYLAWILLQISTRRFEQEMFDESSFCLARSRELSDQISEPIFRFEVLADCAGLSARMDDPAAAELLDKAYVLALNLDDPAPRAGALARTASWFARLEQREKAIDILKEAVTIAAQVEDNLFKDLVLMEIVEILARMGEYERVLDIIGLVEAARFRALCQVALARSCLDSGEEEMAYELADQARSTSLEVENYHFRADILIRIAECLSALSSGPSLPEELPLPSEDALAASTPPGNPDQISP